MLDKLLVILATLLSVNGYDLNQNYEGERQYRNIYKTRQTNVYDLIYNFEEVQTLSQVLLLRSIEDDQIKEVSSVIRLTLHCLDKVENPDFEIIQLVRLLYREDFPLELKTEILTVIETIPLWITEGDDLRVYWSENHMIMYLSSRFLLDTKYGSERFYPEVEGLREYLLWWLELKAETGYYEHNSHYIRYTLFALLNLYDLSDDPEIQKITSRALENLFQMYAKCLNSVGYCIAATSRGKPAHYSKSIMKHRTEHFLSHLMRGTEFSYNSTHPHLAEVALLVTSYVPPRKQLLIEEEVYEEIIFGQTYEKQQEWAQKLSDPTIRTVAAMSMGGYAQEYYIEDTINLIDHLSLWDHKFFRSYKDLRFLPSYLYSSIGYLSSSVSSGSILSSKYKMWKQGSSSLSSLEDFLPGLKGYEQIPWVAGVGDVGVFTIAGETPESLGVLGISHEMTNNQLPKVKQKRNIAIALYYPNTDLKYLFPKALQVQFYFRVADFSEVVELGKWIVGNNNGSFVAVHRACISQNATEENEIFTCYDKAQAWLTMVGNTDTHGSFNHFVEQIEAAKVATQTRHRCISARIEIDGEVFQDKFCERRGVIDSAILISSVCFCCFLVVFVIIRRKRKLKHNSYLNEDNLQQESLDFSANRENISL